MNTRISLVLATSTALMLLPTAASEASVLMLDFGSWTPSDGNLTNSPYHTATTGFSDTAWNTPLATADVASGLIYSDGTAATGVALNLGAVVNSSVIDLDTQPASSNQLGLATNSGVYDGNSIGRDGIWHGSTGQTARIGAQITGLTAGTYDIYVTARNTNTGVGQSADAQQVYVGAGQAGVDFDTATMTNASITFATTSNTVAVDEWEQDVNYFKFTVTLAAGEALNIGSGAPGARGFLNSIQVALVPEPASLALMGLGGLIVLSRRRKG